MQRKSAQFYRDEGYEVEIVRYNQWMKNKDFFGLWDLIVVGKDVRFVQVKSNNKPTKD